MKRFNKNNKQNIETRRLPMGKKSKRALTIYRYRAGGFVAQVPRPQPASQRLPHSGRRRYHHLCKGDFDPDYRLIQNGSLGAGRLRPAPDFAGKEVFRCPITG